MNENAPTIRESALNYADNKVIATIKQIIGQGLTDAELALAIEFCKGTGLNPFKKEIWAIKAGGRLQLMTGINGFFTIANANPQFDGYESGLIDEKGAFVTAAYPGKFIGAWCKVYRKDRRIPSEGVAMLEEYDKKQSTWNTMKRVMITKCAESVALRKAFPQQLNGLYTQEEMPTEYAAAPLQLADDIKPKNGTAAHPEPEVQDMPDYESESQDPETEGPIYLKVPYSDKDRAKELGARWDMEARQWMVPEGIDPAPFAKWRL